MHFAVGGNDAAFRASMDGAAMGDVALRDFRSLCETVGKLDGGVWCGIDEGRISADALAHAVAAARNLGFPLEAVTRGRIGANAADAPPHVAGPDIRLVAPSAILLPFVRQALLAFTS